MSRVCQIHHIRLAIANAFAGRSSATLPKLPNINAMKRRMGNIICKIEQGPIIILLSHREEIIVFPMNFTTLSNGKQFLYYGSSYIEKNLLAMKQNLSLILRSRHCYVDGTFKSVPLLIYQPYTLKKEEGGGRNIK